MQMSAENQLFQFKPANHSCSKTPNSVWLNSGSNHLDIDLLRLANR